MEKTVGRRVYQKYGKQKAVLGEREKRRLLQLGICLVLFLAVFFAKGTDRLGQLRADLAATLQADVDFQAVFSDLGWSIASGRSVKETLDEVWTSAFLVEEKEEPERWQGGPLYQSVQKNLGQENVAAALLLGEIQEESREDPMAASGARAEAEPPLEEAVPEPAVVYVDYTGPALPDNTTMDRYALGLSETLSPVMAVLTSGFGWREHPIEGGEKFHYGVDLAAETGTPIGAFAEGTVDYIGESDVYGLYLQLRHDNGITSFYAHCSKLCVQQGQKVAEGEKVAEVGATGEVTGPHLHFELKKDGVRLNPAYYIQTLS